MFVGETDQFTGFDYDLASGHRRQDGRLKFDFVKTSFDSIIMGIQAGNYDAVMSGMYDNKTRQETSSTSSTTRKDGTGMLVPKGNPKGIKTFDDLAGQAVGAEKGTTQADALAKLNEIFKAAGKPEMTINQFPDQPAALLAVQSGKIVADLTDSSTAGYIAVTDQQRRDLRSRHGLEPAGRLGDPAGWHRRAQEQHRAARRHPESPAEPHGRRHLQDHHGPLRHPDHCRRPRSTRAS